MLRSFLFPTPFNLRNAKALAFAMKLACKACKSFAFARSVCLALDTVCDLSAREHRSAEVGMELEIPTIQLNPDADDVCDIARAIEAASEGVLWVTGALPELPSTQVESILSFLATDRGQDLGKRLNNAYTKNLVFKDSYADGQGGVAVDRKRVLDLSPERLEAIAHADPSLIAELKVSTDLQDVLEFWKQNARASLVILQALAQAIGSGGSDESAAAKDVLADFAFNYRRVDYYRFSPATDAVPDAPRCGEHRDFGSFTLIHGCHQPGLQVRACSAACHCSTIVNAEWQA